MPAPRALLPLSLLTFGLLATAAWAQSAPPSLGEALVGRRAAAEGRPVSAPVARYMADEGPSFILDQRTGAAFLRFDGSDEIWVLRPDHGPRGELIWRNDVGRPVLSASRLGGMTVFTQLRPGGAPVAFHAPAEALRPAQITPQDLHQRFVEASVRATRAVGRLVRFEGLMDIRPGEEPVLADAANLASSAIVRMAARPSRVVAQIRRVRMTRGPRANAQVSADTVIVTINPAQGVAGRPSSDRIALAIARGR